MKKTFNFIFVLLCAIGFANAVYSRVIQPASGIEDVIVRPTTDDAGHNAWTASSGTDKWAMVDEEVSDGDTTYIYKSDSESSQRFTNLPTLPAGTILGVSVCYTGKIAAGAGFTGESVIGVNGSSYYGTDDTLSGTYAEYCYEWTTNPDTSSAWVKADVEGSGSNPVENWGVWPENLGSGDTMRATQAWLKVRYN